ncbi:hypothetical protein SEUBUCD646_0G03300 [Saccharomyces eubayanus]|uniref:BED-type domain-containing protein n=1 Tax=Saccharomyces eubayanus TaxID=1080349 RepID=A0ABN8VQP5_SACEU|nr:hypothetical protein SEUBUCD650_0G03280 [Saccharomyces eubayanus]CAI2023272.1 hypothetical protein SEUBUCD646_0G03300 [Saccharomyces eubayanus]
MNTTLGDLHEDLVTLEDNEIIDTTEHSTHSSSQSTSHGEEENEEGGIEDVETIEKDGSKRLLKKIHPEDEIVNDGSNIWIPVQMLKKNIAKFWSHFLAIDKELTRVKCKHCGEVLTRNDPSLTKTFRFHIKSKHNISANKNFYSMNFTVRNSILTDSNSHARNSLQPNYRSLTFNSNSIRKCYDINKLQNNTFLSFPRLIAIIIASEGLPLNFSEIESFKFLVSKFHKTPPLTTTLIKESVMELSNSIDELIRRSASKSDASLPVNIQLSDTKNSDFPVYLQYTEDIRAQLTSLNLSSLVSLNFTELDKTRSLFSLQVFDNTNKVSKILPLSIFVRKGMDIDINAWEDQLNIIYSKFSGLRESVISLTLPKNYYAKVLENGYSENPTFDTRNLKSVTYHACIVTELLHCFLQPFFNMPTESLLSSFSFVKESHPPNSLLDSLTDFSCLDISSTVLGKISSLIEEININDSLKSDFILYCNDYTQSNCNELISILSFDCSSYSTLQNNLENFVNLVPFFKSINSHLKNESLTDSDFRLIITVEETLKTFEQAIEYFASSAPLKFTHTLVFIISLETYLAEIIRNSTFAKAKRPFEKISSKISKVKELYLHDDVNLIGAFLYPSIFQNKNLLIEIFDTTSINKIIDKVTKIALKYLQKFINITNFQSSNNCKNDGPNFREKLISDYETIFMNGSQEIEFLNNVKVSLPESEDLLFSQIIRDDLLRYINRITHELPNAYHDYLNENDISFDGSHFTKIELPEENISDSEEWQLTPMEEIFDIHIPISDTIWNNYINDGNGIEIVNILLRLISVNSASSIRSELSFLHKASQHFDNELYEEKIKIKILNSQYNLENIDFNSGSIFDTCQ